jgi:hypothetical protein
MAIENYVGKLVSISAEARQRSTADMWRVRDQQPLAQRIGKTALGFILHSESIRNKAVKRVAKFVGGDSVLGHGVEQVVVASGNDAVIKLLIHTISQDRLEVETKAKQLIEQAGVCKDYLADYWLNTQFEPVDLGNNRSAVVARQQRLVDPLLFPSAKDVEVGHDTYDFARRALNLHAVSGLYPDILGVNNLARTQPFGRLCLIDTIPVVPEVQEKVSHGEVKSVGELICDRLAIWEEL